MNEERIIEAFELADLEVSLLVEDGKADKATALVVFGQLRDAFREMDEEIGEKLIAERTEAAVAP